MDAEELLFQGTVRVEDMLRTLPQVYARLSAGQSNGAIGTDTINPRYLEDALAGSVKTFQTCQHGHPYIKLKHSGKP